MVLQQYLQFKIVKDGHVHIFGCFREDAADLIDECITQAYKNEKKIEGYHLTNLDYFDVAFLAYQVLIEQPELEEETDLSKKIAQSAVNAIDFGIEVEKEKMEMLQNPLYEMVENSEQPADERSKHQKRIDILCNDFLPVTKKYFAQVREIMSR